MSDGNYQVTLWRDGEWRWIRITVYKDDGDGMRVISKAMRFANDIPLHYIHAYKRMVLASQGVQPYAQSWENKGDD